MSARNVVNIMAALRFWQDEMISDGGVFGARVAWPEIFQELEPLTTEELDTLCEEINLAPTEALGEAMELIACDCEEKCSGTCTYAKLKKLRAIY